MSTNISWISAIVFAFNGAVDETTLVWELLNVTAMSSSMLVSITE